MKKKFDSFVYDGDFMYQDGVYYVPNWAIEALEEGTLDFIGRGSLGLIKEDGTYVIPVGSEIFYNGKQITFTKP